NASYGEKVDSLPTGQRLLKAKPAERRRYLLAAVAQVRHWDKYGYYHMHRKRAAAAIECLIRRELPLDAADLVAVAERYIQDKYPNPAFINPLFRAFERFVSETPPDEPLLAAMRGLASAMRSRDRKTAAKIDELCAAAPKSEATAIRQSYSPAMPAPVGARGVLDGLKSFFGMLADDSPEDRTIIGPDNFPLPANSPLQKEHEFLNPLLSDRAKFYTKSRCLAPGERGRVLHAAADRDAYNLLRKMAWRERSLATHEFADFLLHSDWQLPREGLFDVLLYLAVRPRYNLWGRGNFDVTSLIPKLEAEAASSPLTEGERFVLSLVRASLIGYPPLDAPAEEINRLSRLIGDGACLCLVPGEAWSDAVDDTLSRAGAAERQSWLSLFRHMLAATTSKPTSKWIATASRLVEALGGETVAHALAGWLALVDKPPQLPRISFQTVDTRDLLSARALMNEQNIVCLRGLLWLAPTLPCRDELLRPVGAVALSAYKKVPGVGARAIKVGNAAIYALSQMASTDAVGQLAMLKVPQWGLRAEFWIGGIGDDYGYTNESGVYLLVSTDQVRFYRSDAAENYADAIGGGYTARAAGPGTEGVNEPLPLEEIPALVFSEVMRDVDLFVGVASVGNDPTWQDGGPEGRYQTYWQSYSFGELSGTATTRKEVLQRLVPRLKIADRCSFSNRFLVVRGNIRTYKIHLGSGNILMEPNDQHLCIVPDARARATQGDLFLPFEGDNMLSIILSKALLLADDAKIKDSTITRQIKGGG
ncbi:MAG: hypothetical protein ACREHD_14270, partial [Pirellulales bacterium]